jgi:cellulose biosynthesis protein BcsQ
LTHPCWLGLEDIQGLMFTRADRSDAGRIGDLLYAVLAPIAEQYELILLDTPPGERTLVEGASAVAAAVAIPTRSDDASIDGVDVWPAGSWPCVNVIQHFNWRASYSSEWAPGVLNEVCE